MEAHKYRGLSPEQYEALFQNYLIDSISYSKIASFARNEKGFEMQYIYREPFKSAASGIGGEAYHAALQFYFSELKKDAVRSDLVTLQQKAYEYIDEVKPTKWKIQKTTPCIEDCIAKANEIVNKCLKNFLSYINLYEDELQEILEVEEYFDEFLTINGVDIPLPFHGVRDLVIRTTDDKLVIVDHKSKTSFSDEEEVKFKIGRQAITYALSYETKHGIRVDEVWIIENKISENRDKSAQLQRVKIILDENTRRLYEFRLYEPLKRMLEAVSNPDYVYLINEDDNFIDQAEINEFWARTLIGEVEDFNIPANKVELIKKRLRKIKDTSLGMISPNIIKKFKEGAASFIQYDLTNKNMTSQQKIEHTLRMLNPNLVVEVAHKLSGYSNETFLLQITAGINISSIFRYKLDIANALNVPNVRINKDLVIYENKAYVAVEAAKTREENLLWDGSLLSGRKIPLGYDNYKNLLTWDLDNQSTPFILAGGAAGSGKSVFLISTLEYAILAGVKNIVILDPKYEFLAYKNHPNINVYNDIQEIEAMLELQVGEMQRLVKENQKTDTLIIFDEFADAIAQSRKGGELDVYVNTQVATFTKGGKVKFKTERRKEGTLKSLEQNMKMLLQKGRSAGFRIIAATQRASVQVITGDAKANFSIIISFRMPKEVDSKVMLDEAGAECLTGFGDGLIRSPQYPSLVRFQAFFKK